MDRLDAERRIQEHEHQAAVLRQNPPPAEAAERRRQADAHEREAALLQAALEDHARAESAASRAARDAEQVLVRFTRDMPADALIDNITVPAARGPIVQRRPQPATHTAAMAPEVEVQPGEVRELPGQVAAVLLDGGYVRVLTGAEELKQARAELAAAKRQGG